MPGRLLPDEGRTLCKQLTARRRSHTQRDSLAARRRSFTLDGSSLPDGGRILSWQLTARRRSFTLDGSSLPDGGRILSWQLTARRRSLTLGGSSLPDGGRSLYQVAFATRWRSHTLGGSSLPDGGRILSRQLTARWRLHTLPGSLAVQRRLYYILNRAASLHNDSVYLARQPRRPMEIVSSTVEHSNPVPSHS